MPFSRITLGVSVGLSVAACAHTASGPPPSTPEAATSAATVDEPLEMEGTCSITKESRVRTYTYSSGRLTASSNSDGVHTTYTYDEDAS
ncbi:MAG: hypothetical protein IPH72_27070 [Sandaracinaceae bacterium]|nr:hypothetical protein [Sandaracinaceae bacterium]